MNMLAWTSACLCLLASGPLAPLAGGDAISFDQSPPESSSVLKQGPFPSDIKRIKERGKLLVAQFQGERPMFFMEIPKGVKSFPESFLLKRPDGSALGGIDIYIAKRMAERLGVELVIKRDCKTFNDVVLAVARGEADVGLSKLCPTPERLQLVTFSKPYATFNVALLANRAFLMKEDAILSSKPSLQDLMKVFNRPEARIAAKENSSAIDQAKALFPKATLMPASKHEDCILAVRDGKADATLNDDFEFLFVNLFDPELEVYCEMLRMPDVPYSIAAAINPDEHNLMGIANEAVDSLRVGDGAALLKQYGRVLKAIEAERTNELKVYPFDSGNLGKKSRAAGFCKDDFVSIAISGALFVCVLSAWMAMAKPRRNREDANG